MESTLWLRLSPLPDPDWLSGALKDRVQQWSTRLGDLLERRRDLQQAAAGLDGAHADFVEAVERVRRENLAILRDAVVLLEEGQSIAGELEAAYREAKEASREHQRRVDQAIRDRLIGVGFEPDVLDSTGELGLAFARVIACHPEARAATQEVLNVAWHNVKPSALVANCLKLAREALAEATRRVVALV